MSPDTTHPTVQPRLPLSAQLTRNDERRSRARYQRELVIASLLRCPERHDNDARPPARTGP